MSEPESGSGASRPASEILSAAEQLAEDITRAARREADSIRARAGSESDEARTAMRRRIGRLGEMADAMQQQLVQMRSELDALRGSLGASDGADAVGVGEPEPEPGSLDEPTFVFIDAPDAGSATGPEPVTDPDEVAARLVALNMAMSGASREETARYLREHHSLADLERLLDEVYAGAGR
jgi:hypothetical protein